jgi:NitT/TauT family transport system permease protein
VSAGSAALSLSSRGITGRPARVHAFARRAGRLVLGLAVAALVWESAVVLIGIKPHYLPRLSVILASIAATPRAYVDGFARTLAETLIGFVAGGAFGVLMAIAFFRLRALREMVFPIFIVSQTIPVIAFGALVVLWFGNTLLAKAVIAFYLTFFPVTVNTLLGLETVDPRQVALMRSFGASRWQLLLRLQLPTALPQIFVALRLASSLSLVGAIVGEWFGDTTGLGVLLLQAMYTENVVAIWGALLVSALLGTGFYACVAAVERRLVFWSAEQ